MFVDKVQVELWAGDGGDGIVSFRHEKFIDKGGPDGGDGGRGGNIIFEASRNQNTLASFRYQKQLKAASGQPGSKRRKHGRSAADLIVKLPVGTVVLDENGAPVADLTTDGTQTIIAQGGQGGFGNAHFVSSTRQAPRVAEKGEKGEHKVLTLELKMIADVGIVGLPNAGKSTLLAALSNARPEIANYPFTTLRPNLGMVDVDETMSLLFADIPGLIEGAAEGKGLGDEFLRHVERTQVLIHVIDIYHNDITEAYQTIQSELRAYRVDLSKRPQLVILNKIDGLDSDIVKDKIDELTRVLPKKVKVFAISAQSKTGVKDMLYTLKDMVNKERKRLQDLRDKNTDTIPTLRLKTDNAWNIEQLENGFRVSGRKIEKFATRTDFANFHAQQRLRDIMKKMGIMHELERHGIQPDQKIYIGDNSLDY
jgi:GTP-binding protein